MKKKTLSPALLLALLFCSGLLTTGLSVQVVENSKSIQSEKQLEGRSGKDLDQEDDGGEFMIWESVARHLLTFSR